MVQMLLLFLGLFATAQDVAVHHRPAPPGTSGRLEAEVLVKMELQVEGMRAVRLETERIAFVEFVVRENAGGVAVVDMHYVRSWTHDERADHAQSALQALHGRRIRVRYRPSQDLEVEVVDRGPSLDAEMVAVVHGDFRWLAALVHPEGREGAFRVGQSFDTSRLMPFVANLGEGADGTVQSVVRGTSSVHGRPTLAVDWNTRANWSDGGIGVRFFGEGVLHVDRDLGVGSKLKLRGPLVFTGARTYGESTRPVTGTGSLSMIAHLDIENAW